MSTRKVIVRAMLAVLVLSMGLSYAQEGQRRGGQGRGGERPQAAERQAREGMDAARMRQMMGERMKAVLQATDEEWAVMEPFIDKITQLNRELSMGVARAMMGGRQMPERAEQGAEPSPLAIASRELNAALANQESTPEQIAEKLEAFRAARELTREELANFQGALREIASARQEARLVLMGILD